MGTKLLLLTILAASLLITGCPPQPLPPPEGYTERYYSAIHGPASLAGGEQLLLNGDTLWRTDSSGIKLSEHQLPRQSGEGISSAGYEWQFKSLEGEHYLLQDYYWLSRVTDGGSLAWSSRFKAVVGWFEPLPEGGVACYWSGSGNSTDDRLQVVNSAGKELWGRSFKYGSYIYPTLGAPGEIYITSGQSLLCLSSATGQTIWEVPAGNTGGIILDGDAEGLLTAGSALAAYNNDGILRWLAAAGTSVQPRAGLLLGDGGAALIGPGTGVGSRVALYSSAGLLRDVYDVPGGGEITAICLVGDDRLALSEFSVSGFNLRLISLADGSELCSLPLPAAIANYPPNYQEYRASGGLRLAADGLLWVQHDNVLYGVDSAGDIQRSYLGTRYFERIYGENGWL